MVEQVRSVLRPQDEALVADLVELELERRVDVVFSSAVFHWVLDHEALFRSLRGVLKPGGRLATQNGGVGNIERLRASGAEVASREPYARYFRDFEQPWNYAGPEETEEGLKRADFVDVRCWLQPWDILPPEPAEFLRTVCLGPHVDRLPEEHREAYVADVLAMEEQPLCLRYVRLNIEARADNP